MPGARGMNTIGHGVLRGGIRVYKAARPNCHMLSLSHLDSGRVLTASMPATARPHCILDQRFGTNWGFRRVQIVFYDMKTNCEGQKKTEQAAFTRDLARDYLEHLSRRHEVF